MWSKNWKFLFAALLFMSIATAGEGQELFTIEHDHFIDSLHSKRLIDNVHYKLAYFDVDLKLERQQQHTQQKVKWNGHQLILLERHYEPTTQEYGVTYVFERMWVKKDQSTTSLQSMLWKDLPDHVHVLYCERIVETDTYGELFSKTFILKHYNPKRIDQVFEFLFER
ncbi:MAG: hypothetical protein AAFO07_09775 [Bacteroidota bacterium]